MADVLLSDSRMRDLQSNNDTMSDYSDSTTQDSHDGDKERDPEMLEERFRVDRKKLEQMLQAAAEGKGQSAEEFFQKIMDETHTTITWPSKLKIGAKSKKDPHIKVCGKLFGVQEAKEKVMAVLDSKSNRVTLKMDVSHTDHSHVIGKGGNNIKKVMLDTGCHIHFPDSNRNNLGEKSNQVSIAGQPDGVEKARQQIRELLPLVFTFDLQSPAIRPLDLNTPIMQQIQQLYNITVSFKQKSQSSAALVIVRGSQSCSSLVLKGVNFLMDHLLAGLRVPVFMTLEIAPQHHAFMVGRQGVNIKQIMSQTGAIIQFPDGNSPNERRSTVTIQGTVESVYLARQQILGCLPLVLMFDMKEDLEVESIQVSKLMEQLDLFISIKPKPKQPSKSVIVKSIESNSENMYIARKRLLDEKFETPFISTSIPSIHSPYLDINTNNSLGLSMIGQNILNINTSMLTLRPTNQMSPLSSPTSSPASPTCWNTNRYLSYYPYTCYSRFANLTPMQQSQFDFYAHYNKLLPEHSTPNHYVRIPTPSDRAPSSNTSNMSSPANSPRNSSPIERVNSKSDSPQLVSDLGLDSYYGTPDTSEVRSSLDSNSIDSLTAQLHAINTSENDVHVMKPNDSYLDGVSRKSSPSNSGNIADLRKILNSSNGQTILKNVSLFDGALNVHFQSESTCSNNSEDSSKMVQGCEWKELLSQHLNQQQQQQQLSLDYEYKKLMATKAMQKKPVGSESRTPTDLWAGLGFSKSMPDSMIRDKLRLNLPIHGPNDSTYENCNGDIDKDPWKESRSNHISAAPGEYPSVRRRRNEYNLSSSNHIDSVSLPKSPWSNKTDLPSLFSKLGLGKYTDLFQQQEIDLATFLTLTDQDLKELGISTFGARRKMLLAISDLTKRRQFSPTPGSNNPFRMSGASSSSSTTPSNLSNGIATSSACW